MAGQQFEGVTSLIYDDYSAGRQIAHYADELKRQHFLFVGVSEVVLTGRVYPKNFAYHVYVKTSESSKFKIWKLKV